MFRRSLAAVLSRKAFTAFVAVMMVTIVFASVNNVVPNVVVDEDEDGSIELEISTDPRVEPDQFFAQPKEEEHDFGQDQEIIDLMQERFDAYDIQRDDNGRETLGHDTPLLAEGVPRTALGQTDTLPYGYKRVHKSEIYPSYAQPAPVRLPGLTNEDDYITYSTMPTTPILYSVEPELRLGENPLHFEKILLVDDDCSVNNGGPYTINSAEDPAYGTPYQDTLSELGYSFDVYTVVVNSHGPSLDVMDDYDLVIWVHGYNYNAIGAGPTLTATDQVNIASYFDLGGFMWMGGNMWIADTEIAGGGYRTLNPGDFLYDQMHMSNTGLSFSGDTEQPYPMFGSEGGIEDGGRYLPISDFTEDEAQQDLVTQLWPQLGQGVKPVYDADPDYYYYPYLGTSWEGSYKYVCMGSEWSWINASNRPSSMQNIMDFFFPPRDYGCHISPTWQAKDIAAGGIVPYAVNITNTGLFTGLDVYDISYVTTEGWEILFYEDDGITPLTDNNMDGYVDTSVIDQYEYKNIIAKVLAPANVPLDTIDTAEVTFRSQEDPSFTKTAVLETTVPYYGGEWDPIATDSYAREDKWVMLSVDLQNGGASDTLDLTYSSSQGWVYTFYEEDGITPLINTGGSGVVDTGVMDPLEHMNLRVRVDVPISNPPGTLESAVITSTSVADPGASEETWFNLSIAYEIEYNEDVESGDGLFTHGAIEGISDHWGNDTSRSHSPSTSWTSGIEIGTVSDTYLESPFIFLEYRDAPSAKMDMYHWYSFYDASYFFEDGIVDGGIVEVWDGVTQQWNYVVPDEGYDGPMNSDFLNPLAGIEAFGGSSGSRWNHDYFDVYPFVLNGINQIVVNESFAPSGGTFTLPLANIGIIDLTLYRDRGSWELLDDRDDYGLDPATGEITLSQASQGGDTYHAFYNYTLGNVIKFRWRVGTDIQATGTEGWFIDDIRVRMPQRGAIVKPDYQEAWGYDGNEVSFNFTVENIGYDGPDTFDLEYATNLGWSAQFYNDAWGSVTDTGSLASGMTKTYYVNVSIPGSHTGGYDFGAVWANSTNGGVPESIDVTAIRPYVVGSWSEDFESGIAEYLYLGSGIGEATEWHLSPNVTHSPSNSMYFGQEAIQNYTVYDFGIIDSPLLEIGSGGNYAELRIWHDYDFEAGYDGGYVEIGYDNGSVYEQIYPERGYDWTIAPGWGNFGIEGKAAFSGSSGAYIEDSFEISDYVGDVIKVSFIAGSDAVQSYDRGWNIDDLSVIAPDYGIGLKDDVQVGFGNPGDDAVYEVEVRNKGKNSDTYTFSGFPPWTITYMDDQWNILSGGDTTPSMASGEARMFYINITIPGGTSTTFDRSDIITVTSNGDGSKTDTMTLNTYVANQLLVVIDDFENDIGSGGVGYDGYADLITSTYGADYDLIDVWDEGYPNLMGMQLHTGVIWASTGIGTTPPMGNADYRPTLYSWERDLIGQYLDGGGRMYHAGNLAIGSLVGGYNDWAGQYFGWTDQINWGNYPTVGLPGYINGSAGTIMEGNNVWHAPIIGGHPDADDLYGVDWEGGLAPFEYIFTEGPSNDAAGLILDTGIARRMSTSFHFINIQDFLNSSVGRQALMQDAIDFLFPVQDIWISPKEKYSVPSAPSTEASYTLNVRNAGNTTDSFAITQQSGSWTAAFYDEGWIGISDTGSMQPNEVKTIYVNVSVPGVAIPGDADTALIRFNGGAYWTDKDLFTVVPQTVPYSYDAEGLDGATSDDGWTVDTGSLWHIEDTRKHAGSTSWAFNDGIDYNTSQVEQGALYSPWIDLSGGSFAELTWWEFVETENFGVGYDTCWVYVSTDGFNWGQVYVNPLSSGAWIQRTVDLSSYVGNSILIKFYFSTGDTNKNDFEGWFIDDVQVINPPYKAEYDREYYFGFEDAGNIASVPIVIKNRGEAIDTFNLNVMGETWVATIYDQTHASVISSIQLDPDENTTIYVDINIPGGAAQTDDDTGTLRATSSGDASQWDVDIRTYVKDPVLLVSDDFENNIDSYYQAMLDANQYGGFYSYDWIDTYTLGSPSVLNMLDHDIVIWHTVGSGTGGPSTFSQGMFDSRHPLTPREIEDIGEFLDNNGRMYMSSNVPYAVKTDYYVTGNLDPVQFAYDYLGLESYLNFPWPYPQDEQHLIWGVDENIIGDGFDGLNQVSLHNPTGDGHTDCKQEGTSSGKWDWINYEGGFEPAFIETWWDTWATATTLDQGNTRRVWTSWDLASVDKSENRNEIMRRILTFLAPPPTGVTVSPNYQLGQVYAGDTYVHELTIKNIGASSDIYDITISGDTWTTTLYEADGVTLLSDHGGSGAPDTGTLSPLEDYTVVVEVQTPGGAVPGNFNQVTINATSVIDGSTWMESDVNTSIPYLILLVDDDASVNNGGDFGLPLYYHYAEDPTLGAPGHGTPYADELTNLGYQFDTYVVPVGEDGPPQDVLDVHHIVIWVCGGTLTDDGTLNPIDQVRLANFLDQGGRLWLDSAGLGWDVAGSYAYKAVNPGNFLYEYLGIDESDNSNGDSPLTVTGVSGSIMDSESYATTTYWEEEGIYEEFGIRVAGGLQGAWNSDAGDSLPYVASQWDNGVFKTFYTGVEWAHINTPGNRNDAMANIMNWFLPLQDVVITPPEQEWYGTPNSYVWFNMTVQNKGDDPDSFTMSENSPSGWTYDYYENDMVTPLPGDSTGSISSYGQKNIAVRVTVPIVASGGDWEIGVVTATSQENPSVDTNTSVNILVYEAPGTDYKSVYVGYMPEKDGGVPVTLFSDDVESGTNGWTTDSVFTPQWGGGPSVVDWHIVDPETLPDTWDPAEGVDHYHGSAHSPSNVWWAGHDVNGTWWEWGHTWYRLYSPTIDLTAYDNAEVTFWQWMNFDWWWAPETFVMVNDGSGWENIYSIPQLQSEMQVWREITVNLEPYAGQSIQIGFNMSMTTGMDGRWYPGWYLDDISVSGFGTPTKSDGLLYNSINWTTGGNLIGDPAINSVDYYGTSTLMTNAVTTPSFAQGAPDDSRAILQDSSSYVGTGGNWGSGSGTITKVEIGAEYRSPTGLQNGYVRVACYDSVEEMALPIHLDDHTSHTTDYQTYVDITDAKPYWTWAELGNQIPYVCSYANNGSDVEVDAVWLRVTSTTDPVVRVALIDSWGTVNQGLWGNFADRHGDVLIQYMEPGTFTYGEIIMTQADVVLISGASREYSPSEIADLQRYADEGHGLLGTGDFMDYSVLGNKDVAPLFGLKNETIPWSVMFTEYAVDIPSHPIMDGLANPFTPDDPTSLRTSTGAIPEDAIIVAHADTIESGVIAVMENDTTPPGFAGQTAPNNIGSYQLDLNWAPASDANPTITYNVYMKLGPSPVPWDAPSFQTTNTNGFTVTGLAPSTQYSFLVRAEDAYGNEEGNTAYRTASTTAGAGSDGQAPAIQNLNYGLNPAGDTVTVQYRANDTGLGNSNIFTAGYDILGEFSGFFPAKDGSFDEVIEQVQSYIDVSSLSDGTYTLEIKAWDVYGNEGMTSVQFTKGPRFTKMLSEGWNFLSIPLNVADNSLTGVLSSIAGNYNAVQFYNNTAGVDGWEHYNIDDPLFSDFDYIDHHKGFWINITSPTVLVISGTIPGSTGITLREGWNMVGYPSQSITSSVGDKLSTITYDKIAGPDEYGLDTRDMLITDLLIPGSGYWIHVPTGTGSQTWTVT